MNTSTLEEGEASRVDIAQLAAQARAAFDQKRMRECIALTNALALADPDNAEARALQSVINMGIQRDLNDVRALLEDSRNTDEAQKYRKAAEIILLKILYLDPANEQAKVLLTSTKALAEASAGAATGLAIPAFSAPTVVAAPVGSASPARQESATPVHVPVMESVLGVTAPAPITEPTPIVVELPAAFGASHEDEEEISPTLPLAAMETAAPAPITEPAPIAVELPAAFGASHEDEEEISRALPLAVMETAVPAAPAFVPVSVATPAPATSARPVRDEEVSFTTGIVRAPKKKKKEEKMRVPLPVVLVAVVLLGGVLLLVEQTRMAGPSALEEQTALAAVVHHASGASDAASVRQPAGPKKENALPVSSQTATPPPAPAIPPAPVATPVPPVSVEASVQTGTLALSSPIAAEIYMNGKRVGSTPTTLKLSPGRQTLEYRYRNRSAVVAYEIRANQTTSGLVTFETTVQINAKPWAEVVLEGASRRSLGETPLSDVRVPIGSVLVFANPNFPSKTQTHRVTAEDTAIQVVFQ